ncbi:hypothetical protein KP509_06G033900 [Ceratopteris richardii]|uniref:Protein kinase domain-containing protein n=1 Tax=Ceratopteris richardii TaxID=49495 RepID=A0A8T2ULU3_CERRI|nr:hypothetical protein KP509_06G033900 [Ceratopteris richardii]KAH7434773.1 hypothetical protein KP509_06G033900 [Ceratopteris richardii]
MQQANSIFLILLCVHVLVAGFIAASEDALLRLKHGFGNPRSLGTWNASVNASPCRGWEGVKCNGSSVVGLDLGGVDLRGGNISSAIAELTGLKIIKLHSTGLVGPIPPEISGLRALEELDLSNNSLTGPLPQDWANLTSLAILTLTNNNIDGGIPANLSDAPNLKKVRLERNKLSGPISAAIFVHKSLQSLAVEFNNINGSIPAEIGEAVSLRSFYAGSNRLEGSIPDTIGALSRLKHFHVDHNQLSGPLPPSIVNLTASLLTLNVSYNNLTGQIPPALAAKINDTSAFVGNPFLCGFPLAVNCSSPSPASTNKRPPEISPEVPHDTPFPDPKFWNGKKRSSSKTKIIIEAVGSLAAFFIFMILMWIFVFRDRERSRHASVSTAKVQNWFSPDIQDDRRKGRYEVFSEDLQYSYEDLVSNAGFFDTAHVLGKGRFGTVYRSHLPNGSLIAVKVFRYSHAAPSFERDLELLASIKHRNLLTVKGFYVNPVEKAVFYDYIPTGTLYEVLHGRHTALSREDALPSWQTRHIIALGVARAMTYLHRGCGYKILHRDLKSTNVLLEADWNPRVSDHGLAHLASPRPGEVAETPGYTAPEVVKSKKSTEKGDVYSFGVVLLELLTGQEAVSYVEGNAVKLTDWVVKLHVEGRGQEAIEPIVLKTCPLQNIVDKCLNLAVLCVDSNPNHRPTMAEVASVLEDCNYTSPLRSPDVKIENPLLPFRDL